MKRQEEREVSAQAAEEIDRVALGERLRECEIANSIRGEPFGRDRRFNRYYWCALYIAHLWIFQHLPNVRTTDFVFKIRNYFDPSNTSVYETHK